MSDKESAEHSSGQPAVMDFAVQTEDDARHGGGGGGKAKEKKKSAGSIEERARRVLGADNPNRPGNGSGGSSQQPSYPPHGVTAVGGEGEQRRSGRFGGGGGYVPFADSHQLQGPPTALALQAFQLSSVIRPPERTPPVEPPSDAWASAGSLKPFEGEEVYMRRAGILNDYFNLYVLMTYIMLTNRRIVIKQTSMMLGFNLYTVESSFLYENLRHMTIQRITNFKFLWGGAVAILLAIVLFALGADSWIFPIIGIGVFFGGIFAIYWFTIFYNANSLVIDFSKDDLVGTWAIPRGKGAFTSKVLVLHIDHCFDVAYALYNQAGTVFAENKV